MKITLDGQPLNYTLEGEQNLYQVLASIAQWLSSQNAEITHLSLNGKPLDQWNQKDFETIPIREIDQLDITTATETEQEFNELEILLHYFSLLQRALESRDPNPLMDILSEYPHVQPPLEHYLRSVFLTEGSARFPIQGVPSKEDDWKQAEQFVQKIVSLLESRLYEITHPYETCESLIPILDQTKQEIEHTSVLLQTGRDREAIRNVLTFIEILSKALRILSRLHPSDHKVKEVHKNLSPPLKELNEAFLHRDSVLIGDLLEYEIAPKLEELRALLLRTLAERTS
ncbi:MAG: hypothetical protein N2442_13060 [Spirochaetes bacterium]|nr:hypothetical protein [Spirochaetota bacterium]